MTSPGMLIAALVVAIAIILFCIIVLKLNAAIGMVIACLVMGLAGDNHADSSVELEYNNTEQNNRNCNNQCRN